MKTRIVLWVSLMTALLFAATAKAQPVPIVDCSCLATQAQSLLTTNACQGIVPDLCQFTNCYRSTVVPPPPLFCSQNPPAGTVLGPGNHPITVTVMDASGQSSQCVLNFSVIPPPNTNQFDLLCASNKVVYCDIPWTFDPPTPTNYCCPQPGVPNGGVSIFAINLTTNGTCPAEITQTWMARDACGKVAMCSQTVTQVDIVAPIIICASNQTVQCNTAWSFGTPSATDNCTAPSDLFYNIISTSTNFGCGLSYVAQQVWMVHDLCGNASYCTQTVSVVDTVAPTITCGTNKTVQCGTTWTFDVPTVFDNCNNAAMPPTNIIVSVVNTLTNGFCPRVITRTWRATDGCGNSSQCSQTITVVDTIAPVLDCNCLRSSPNVPLNVVGCSNTIPNLCSLISSASGGTTISCATDNCGPISCFQSPAPGTVVGPGTYPITITVYDCVSNSAQCTVLFTVVAPTTGCGTTNCAVSIICPTNVTAFTCSNSAVVFYPPPIVNNPCGSNVSLVCNPPSGSTFPLGTTPVSCSILAATGVVIDQCIFNVTVLSQPSGCPTNCAVRIICPTNITVFTCSNSVVVNYPAPTVINPCASNIFVNCNPPSGSTFPLGTNTVTCVAGIPGTVPDQCNFLVIVLSQTNGCPTNTNCTVRIICPTNIFVSTCTNSVVVTYPAPTVINPCGSNVFVVCNPPSGSTFPPGTNIVTCTVGNAAGPVAQCSFLVVVTATGGNCCTNIIEVFNTGMGGPSGNILLAAGTPDPNYSLVTAPGSCTIAQVINTNTMPAPPWVGTGPNSQWIGGGPNANCDAGFYVYRLAVNITCPSNAMLSGQWTADDYAEVFLNGVSTGITAPSPGFPYSFTGWHPLLLTNGFVCGTNFIDFYVTNAHGVVNPTGFRAQLTNVYNSCCGPCNPPGCVLAIRCPTNITVYTCSNSAMVNYPAPVVVNTCGSNVSIICNPPSGSTFPLGTNMVGCAIVNSIGVVFDQCNFKVIVLPATSGCGTNTNCTVRIVCPTNLYFTTCSNSVVVNYLSPTVINPCASNVFVVCNPPSGSSFPVGVTPVTCTVGNAAGPIDQCTFVIVVTTPPGGCCTNVTQVFNTGMGGPSGNVLLPAGTIDPNYFLVTAPGSCTIAQVIDTNTMPAPPWIGTGPNSQWIGGGMNAVCDQGFYLYRLAINITCTTGTVVSGRWTADDYAEVFLNGLPTGITAPSPGFPYSFTGWHPLLLTNGFVCGTNFIDFYVTNAHAAENPTGFRAELTNTYNSCCGPCTPPGCVTTIRCPTNITVSTCTSNAVVNYPAPVVVNTCGSNVTVVCNPPSGSIFPIGTTTVTCNLINATGVLVDHCNFTVTVVSSFCDFINGDFSQQVPVNGTGGGWTTFSLFGGAGWDPSAGNGPPSFLLNNVGDPSTDPTIQQRLCCFRPGQCYTIRGQRRVQAWFGNSNLSFAVLLDTAPILQLPVPTVPADTNWYNFSVSFTATSACHTIGFASEINGTDVSYWLDNLRIECCVTNNCISIVCPTNRTVQTCTNGRPVNYNPPVATSNCGTAITGVTCVPPSGSFFPLGINNVVCTATDAFGNTAQCSFLVIVTGDTTPPNCPPFSMSVTGCPPVMPNFQTSGLITDNCTPSNLITVTQSIAPGTVLPPGSVTVVILTICDASGNCRVCDVVITAVGSGKPPVINCPKDITVLTCSNSAEVIYKVKATGGTFTYMNCTPPSGSIFPLGTNLVTCCVMDSCGYTNCCSFKVIVKSAITVNPNWTATAGVPDNFALPVDASFRTACLTNAFGGYPQWKGFDSYGIDTIFGHRFTGLPGNIVQAQLEIKMRPLNTFGADNDGLFIGLGSSCTFTSFVYAQSIKAIPGAVPPTGGTWSAPSNPVTVFNINLSSPAMLAKLNADQFMDVAVHDDTAVDYMRLKLWLCPPKHPGIGIPFSTLNNAKFAVRPITDDDQAGPAVTVYPDPSSPPSGIVLTPGTPKRLTFTTVLDFNAPEGASFDIGLPPSPENPNGVPMLSFHRKSGPKGYCVKTSTKLWDDPSSSFRTIAIGSNGHLFSSYPWSREDMDTNVFLNLFYQPGVTQAVMTVDIDCFTGEMSLAFPHCIWTPDNARKGWDGCIYGNGTPSKGLGTNKHARVILTPQTTVVSPPITELALTATGLPEFPVENPDVEVSGRKWGDGHVTLMKAYDDEEAANRMMEWTSFGEGGGVNVDLGRTASLDLGIHHFETGDIPTEEQLFRIMLPPRGLTNRPTPPSIPLRTISGPDGLQCSIDFTDVGASGVTVQLWSNGQLVGEGHGEGATIPPESPLTISHWPERWGYIAFNQSIHLYRSEGLMVSGLTGDEIRIFPDLPPGGSPFDYASGLELRTSEGMESAAYGLVRTLACEPGPLHVERSATGTILSWSEEGFRLQGAETVEGPWYDLGVESPVSVETSALMRYFRLTCD
jgi:hypothetical protein